MMLTQCCGINFREALHGTRSAVNICSDLRLLAGGGMCSVVTDD